MCCVQEMERVWGQYERMESELSVIRSHLQHICNFGVPQVIRKKLGYWLWSSICIVTSHLQILTSGTVSGPERTVDDGGHPGWTKDQQGPFLLPAGTSETPQ